MMPDILEMLAFVAVMYAALIVWAGMIQEEPEINEKKPETKAEESWHSAVDSCP